MDHVIQHVLLRLKQSGIVNEVRAIALLLRYILVLDLSAKQIHVFVVVSHIGCQDHPNDALTQHLLL